MEILPSTETKRIEHDVESRLELLKKFDVISSQEQYDEAAEVASDIKTYHDNIKNQLDEIIVPQKESIAAATNFFRQFMNPLADNLNLLKMSMKKFKEEQMALFEKERAEVAAQLNSGEMSLEAASQHNSTLTPTKGGQSQASNLVKYRVTDISKVPLEFLEVDMVKVKASYKMGNPVPGTEAYKEINIAIKKRV
jgi:hypothetical protein